MKAISALAAAALLAGCSSIPPCEDDIEAFVISQSFVKRQLRAPSTASFPSFTDPEVSSTRTTLADGRCAFNVRIYVDAQNAFGGTVRQHFKVTTAPDLKQTDTWDLVEITTN